MHNKYLQHRLLLLEHLLPPPSSYCRSSISHHLSCSDSSSSVVVAASSSLFEFIPPSSEGEDQTEYEEPAWWLAGRRGCSSSVNGDACPSSATRDASSTRWHCANGQYHTQDWRAVFLLQIDHVKSVMCLPWCFFVPREWQRGALCSMAESSATRMWHAGGRQRCYTRETRRQPRESPTHDF
jgi:hypothetical protein